MVRQKLMPAVENPRLSGTPCLPLPDRCPSPLRDGKRSRLAAVGISHGCCWTPAAALPPRDDNSNGLALAPGPRGRVHFMEREFHIREQRGEIPGQGRGSADNRVVEAGPGVGWEREPHRLLQAPARANPVDGHAPLLAAPLSFATALLDTVNPKRGASSAPPALGRPCRMKAGVTHFLPFCTRWNSARVLSVCMGWAVRSFLGGKLLAASGAAGAKAPRGLASSPCARGSRACACGVCCSVDRFFVSLRDVFPGPVLCSWAYR